MWFTVTAVFKGRKVEVTWEDEKLSGDPEAVNYLIALAHIYEGQEIFLGIQFPSTATNHLKSPFSMRYLMQEYFDKILDYSGDPFSLWYSD